MLEGRQYRSAQLCRIIANSRLVEGHIRHYYPVDPARIRVIYNGVDLERFHPERRRWIEERRRRELGVAGELVILFVAHNFRLKGLHCLIRALGKLGKIKGGYQLWVLGRGKEEPYRRLASKLGCADNLRFLGGQAAVEEYYGAADLLVHPTFYDPSANVCLEAMASGLPVITTRYNGVSELMADGGLGEWVLDDPSDAQLLSEKIRQLGDEELRLRLTQRSREIVEGLSWEEHGRQVIQVYREAVASK